MKLERKSIDFGGNSIYLENKSIDLDAAKKRGDKTMQERLMKEFLDASTNKGSAIKKREDTHKMAEANKAFAHFRW